MKTYTYKTNHKKYECVVSIERYSAGNRLFMALMSAVDGEPVIVITTWLSLLGTGVGALDMDEMIVKTYSENKGMEKFLIDNNIATDTGKRVPCSDFIPYLPVYKLTPEFLNEVKGMDTYLDYILETKQKNSIA